MNNLLRTPNSILVPALMGLRGVLVLTVMLEMAFAPASVGAVLCDKAEADRYYNTEFLKNFIGLKRGEAGWLFRDADLKLKFGSNAGGYQDLVKLDKLLKKKGVELIMLPTPTRAIIHPEKLGAINYNVKRARASYRSYVVTLNRLGISTPQFYRLFESTHSKPLFFARDHHWTSAGARMMARLTANKITESRRYQDIKKNEYSSYRVGSQDNNGSLAKAAKILCGDDYKVELVENYLTESTAPQDLFLDSPEPRVALVGTSNSKGRLNFNFPGFLRQYSQVDILNLAESGGGPFGALNQYLASDDFARDPPLVLVWEVPSYYRLNDHENFNKLFALLGEAL